MPGGTVASAMQAVERGSEDAMGLVEVKPLGEEKRV